MREKITFADLALARRLERAEGAACAQFAEARRKLFPESGSEWIECGGAYVVFDGVDSPVTQTFGLGVFEDLSAGTLDTIEKFFQERGAPVMHEVSPLAGVATLELLCARKYRPIEISSVLYRPVEKPSTSTQLGVAGQSNIKVRVTRSDEAALWSDVSARGWGHDHPEFIPILTAIRSCSCGA
ncbi:MAG TPA: hypothetical protein VFB76_16400 [Candidatus Angelobacter sp.]|nr:hypothetical protein [Candidatus Angelobacter sp.]